MAGIKLFQRHRVGRIRGSAAAIDDLLHHPQRRLQAKIHFFPIELGVRGRQVHVRIFQKKPADLREIHGKGLQASQQGLKGLSHFRGMVLVAVHPQRRISSFLVSQKSLDRHLLAESVRLDRGVRRRPIDRPLKLVNRFGWQLNVAVARLATLQVLQVPRFDCESGEIGWFGGIAEFLNREIAGEFTQRIEVICELEISVRRRFNVDCAKHKDLVWNRRIESDRHRFSTMNRIDLDLVQTDDFS